MTIEERLEIIEKANLIERFSYWEERFDRALEARELAITLQKDVVKRLVDFELRLKKIEQFTNYLLDYFNPDNKLKKEIEDLKKAIKSKDEEIEKTRSILKTALK